MRKSKVKKFKESKEPKDAETLADERMEGRKKKAINRKVLRGSY